MAVLDHLEPKSVFRFFEALCAIPHGSHNTRQVSDWLVAFARERGLEYTQDALGNVILFGPPAPGYEAAEPVILQGHMDMVCVSTPECTRDLATEGLDLAVEGDTVYARGSSLGGDDGIAVAMILALLDDKALPHPAIEAVITVDEEVGMDGAMGIDLSALRSRRMINIDSEDEGIFTVSCAGGCVARCTLPVTRAAAEGAVLRIALRGLTGGHSGTEIDKGRASATQCIGRVLNALAEAAPFRLVSVSGGEKDNAIATEAEAMVLTADPAALKARCAELGGALRAEFSATDPALTLTAEDAEAAEAPMDAESTARALDLLRSLPYGVQAMSAGIPGLVETSLNLGILTTEADAVCATFCVRSSVDESKQGLKAQLRATLDRLGGRVDISGDYPGWAYRESSPLRELLTAVYTEQYGSAPRVEAIHAGLECGLFAGKLPGLDCISIGPDLSEIHTTRERMHIASVRRTWHLLTETLARMK